MAGSSTIGARARRANGALAPLAFLVGEWRTTGAHPMLPGRVLTGRTCFDWHEGGAFLRMRTQVDVPEIPDGVAIIGSDDGAGSFMMVYFDERGVSRHYAVSVGARTLTWRHDDPKLAQSNSIGAEGYNRLIGKGRMAQDGGAWGDDLSQVFDRELPR